MRIPYIPVDINLKQPVTREWTRIDPEGAKPLGRYGHAVAMIGTRFYVFGGQVDGEFLNDLWSFDLNSCELKEFVFDLSKLLSCSGKERAPLGKGGFR